MAKTQFGFDIRTALCLECGAPLEVGLGGGRVVCDYCGTSSLIQRRTYREAEPAQTIPETQRLQELWHQDRQPLRVPPGVQRWLVDGRIPMQHRQDALKTWLYHQSVLTHEADDVAAYYLFTLTILLGPLLESRHRRALLEHAVDVLPNVHHRNVIRCKLARHAALDGDIQAAEAWLEHVDPRPRDLMADTAYRLAMSYIALHQGQPRAALRHLGYHEQDVPIFEGFDAEALLLRSHALEMDGQTDVALRRLRGRMVDVAWFRPLIDLSRRDPRLPLCPETIPFLERELLEQAEWKLRPPPLNLTSLPIILLAAFGVDAAVYFQVTRYDHANNSTFVAWAIVFTVLAVGAVVWQLHRYVRERGFRQRATWAEGRTTSTVGYTITSKPVVRARVTHEGNTYSVRAHVVAGVTSSAQLACPCLFDPKTRSARIILPFAPPPPIVPFG